MTQNEKKHILRLFKELKIYDAIHAKVFLTTPIAWESMSTYSFVCTCFQCQEIIQMLVQYKVDRYNFFVAQTQAINKCFTVYCDIVHSKKV